MADKNSPDFIAFIRRILKDLGRMKTRQIDIITAEVHHEAWRTAFTTKYEQPDRNYELYELYGDTSIACAFLHYLRKKYPMLSERGLLTASVARLKINYLDTDTFASFSQQYGLADWVTLPDETAMPETEKSKYLNKHGPMGIYEDVLEAFFGVTERLIDDFILDGLSTTVLRNMLAYMYENSREVSFDFRYTTLFDSKTRLKQTIDYIFYRDYNGATAPEPKKKRGAIFYINDIDPETENPRVTLQVSFPTAPGSDQVSRVRHTLAVVSTGERQKTIEKRAAEIGLQVLGASGYSSPLPKQISTDIERLFGYIGPEETAPYYVQATEPVQTIPGPGESVETTVIPPRQQRVAVEPRWRPQAKPFSRRSPAESPSQKSTPDQKSRRRRDAIKEAARRRREA